MDKQDGAAFELLEIQPTTIAGVTALLAYYVEVEAKNAQPAPMVLCRLRSKVCKRRQSISKTSGTKITPAYSSKHLEL